MDTVTIFTLSAIVVGFVLFLWGAVKNGMWRMGLGLGLVFGPFVERLLNPDDATFRDGVAALSGFAVAIIAMITLYFNFRLRKDSFEKEERDRKERILVEITGWVTGLEGTVFKTGDPFEKLALLESMGMSSDEMILNSELKLCSEEITRLFESIYLSKYMMKLAAAIDDDLGNLIGEIGSQIAERKNFIDDEYTFLSSDNSDEEKVKALNERWSISAPLQSDNADTIRKSISQTIDRLIELRVNK